MGVLIFCNFSPFGRIRLSSVRPTGSGSAATSLNPLAMPSMRLSSSLSRSSIAGESPLCLPASMSRALASLIEARFFSSASAMAIRQEFFSAVASPANFREAVFARRASSVICSRKFTGPK